MTFKFIVELKIETLNEEEALKRIKSGLRYNEIFDNIHFKIQYFNKIQSEIQGDKRQLV